jgi:hypothetical protein
LTIKGSNFIVDVTEFNTRLSQKPSIARMISVVNMEDPLHQYKNLSKASPQDQQKLLESLLQGKQHTNHELLALLHKEISYIDADRVAKNAPHVITRLPSNLDDF